MNTNVSLGAALSTWFATHLPPNRVVAFFGPVFAIIAGAIAAWVVAKFPGLHLKTSTVAGEITQGLEFAVGALVTFGLQHKWLSGWQAYEATQSTPTPVPTVPAGEYNPATDMPGFTGTPAADAGGGPVPGSGQASDGGR